MVHLIQTPPPPPADPVPEGVASEDWNWVCPDLTPYWKLLKIKGKAQVFLKAGEQIHEFSEMEGYALMHFTGQFTVHQVQERCQRKFPALQSPQFVVELCQKLVNFGILATETPHQGTPRLKNTVHWIQHPDGYWLLRNSENISFLQVSDRDHFIISQLGTKPVAELLKNTGISLEEFQQILRLLSVAAMLEGSTPPQTKSRKFTPLQLLFFKIRLFNPDPFLTLIYPFFRWIWTKSFGLFLLGFISYSVVIGSAHQSEILQTGQQLWQYQGAALILPFALLTGVVVTLHELGHALTLKHYKGTVPDIGLLLMFFMPAAYTNTTDLYCLIRWKRILVVAAGVIVQFAIAAFAFWLWELTAVGTWLHTASYLLMIAALFTIALNLNPLAKFDGYYLAVAVTGINNLRARSFEFYQRLFSFKPISESKFNQLILAFYAPLSFVYIQFIFGYLLYQIVDWVMLHIPMTAIALLSLWSIYYFVPNFKTKN